MLNQELELSLNMAFARAREHRHEFMTVEHLLLALLSNPSAREALEACSVDLVALRQELEAFIEQTTPVLPATEEERDTQPTLSFQRAIPGGQLGEGAAIAVAMIPFLLAAILFSFFGLQRRKWQQGGQD